MLQLIDKDDSYDGLYVDLVKKSSDVLDSYFWIDKEETENLADPLRKIRDAAKAAVEEFEKVVRVRRDTQQRTAEVQTAVGDLIKQIERSRFESIDDFVSSLANLREQRGHALGLRELRYVDESIVAELEKTTAERAERISRRCVDFLLTPGSLDPYVQSGGHGRRASWRSRHRRRGEKAGRRNRHGRLAIGIVDRNGQQLANRRRDQANRNHRLDRRRLCIAQSRPQLAEGTRGELVSVEGQAEFASQLKLLEQTTSGYLDVCDSPDKCDEYLTKVMVQLEELEGRFAEFDEFVVQLATRREEVYAAFESRKVSFGRKTQSSRRVTRVGGRTGF